MVDARRMGEAVQLLHSIVHRWNEKALVLEEFGSPEAPLLRRVREDLRGVLEAFGTVELDLESAAAFSGSSTRTLRRKLTDKRLSNHGKRFRPRIRLSDVMGTALPPLAPTENTPKHRKGSR